MRLQKKMASGWSEKEDGIIRENYPNLGTRVCAALLEQNGYHRTHAAIKEHAKNLGVRRNMKSITRVSDAAWTQEEIDVLERVFPLGGAVRVQEELARLGRKRTVGAITTRAAMLGVKMRNTKRRMTKGGDKRIINLCFDTTLDKELIAHLDGKRNRSAYVRELVANDMAING